MVDRTTWSRLPPEIAIKLAFYIPSSVDFFAFLEAFSPTNLPEPLEQIRQLGVVKKRSDLWPRICLNRDDEKLDPAFQQKLASVVKYYDVVIIRDVPTLPWLTLAHLKTNISLYWCQDDSSIETTSIAKLSQAVTHIMSYKSSWNTPNLLNYCLTDYSRLRALDLYIDDALLLESTLSSVADSSQIVELGIDFDAFDHFRDDILFTTSMANSVIRWVKSQPVRYLSFSRWDIQIDNPDVTKSFYEALLNCPTLDELECIYSKLHGIELASLSFAMETLIFNECEYDAFQLAALANGLSLSLYGVGLNGDSAKLFAKALEKNHSITHLSVSGNSVGFDGLKSLIASDTSANRAVKLKSMWFACRGCTPDERQALEKLARQCGVAINVSW
ncbi:hypothetical protein AC1031_005853 [Aphanomyces cochlioides]|nr:hypothetical protein AC1031_005853 [Aphanomyces cochlioides]